MRRNFNSRLGLLESFRREQRRGHRLDVVELHPDGTEVLLWSEPNSTADFNRIVIVIPPKESEEK